MELLSGICSGSALTPEDLTMLALQVAGFLLAARIVLPILGMILGEILATIHQAVYGPRIVVVEDVHYRPSRTNS